MIAFRDGAREKAAPAHFPSRGREYLALGDRIRREAGEQITLAFPRSLKRYVIPGVPISTLSKARHGDESNAFARAAVCLMALRAGGGSRASALQLLDWLRSWVDEWWPEEETPPTRTLVRQAAAIDGEELVAEAAYLSEEPTGLRRWIRALRRRAAHDPILIRALQREAGPA